MSSGGGSYYGDGSGCPCNACSQQRRSSPRRCSPRRYSPTRGCCQKPKCEPQKQCIDFCEAVRACVGTGTQGPQGGAGPQGPQGVPGTGTAGGGIIDFAGTLPAIVATALPQSALTAWGHAATDVALPYPLLPGVLPIPVTVWTGAARTLSNPVLVVSVTSLTVAALFSAFSLVGTVYVNDAPTAVTASITFASTIGVLTTFVSTNGTGTANVPAGGNIKVILSATSTGVLPALLTLVGQATFTMSG